MLFSWEYILDTHQQEFRLPSEKLERILATLIEWERWKSCTRRVLEILESLIGTFQRACTVIHPGETFFKKHNPTSKDGKRVTSSHMLIS